MKKAIPLYIPIIAIMAITTLNCRKSTPKPVPACGCDASVIKMIHEDTGTLLVNTRVQSFINCSGGMYEIQTGRWGASSNYFICDTSIQQLKNLDPNVTYSVIFSGDASKSCIPNDSTYTVDNMQDTTVYIEDTMYNIKLTNLTVLNPACGCTSRVIKSVDSLQGDLHLDSIYNQYYIVTDGPPGFEFIICNNDFPQLQSIMTQSPNNYVFFSGDVTNACPTNDCTNLIVYGVDAYYNIKLTDIIKQ